MLCSGGPLEISLGKFFGLLSPSASSFGLVQCASRRCWSGRTAAVLSLLGHRGLGRALRSSHNKSQQVLTIGCSHDENPLSEIQTPPSTSHPWRLQGCKCASPPRPVQHPHFGDTSPQPSQPSHKESMDDMSQQAPQHPRHKGLLP